MHGHGVRRASPRCRYAHVVAGLEPAIGQHLPRKPGASPSVAMQRPRTIPYWVTRALYGRQCLSLNFGLEQSCIKCPGYRGRYIRDLGKWRSSVVSYGDASLRRPTVSVRHVIRRVGAEPPLDCTGSRGDTGMMADPAAVIYGLQMWHILPLFALRLGERLSQWIPVVLTQRITGGVTCLRRTLDQRFDLFLVRPFDTTRPAGSPRQRSFTGKSSRLMRGMPTACIYLALLPIRPVVMQPRST